MNATKTLMTEPQMVCGFGPSSGQLLPHKEEVPEDFAATPVPVLGAQLYGRDCLLGHSVHDLLDPEAPEPSPAAPSAPFSELGLCSAVDRR